MYPKVRISLAAFKVIYIQSCDWQFLSPSSFLLYETLPSYREAKRKRQRVGLCCTVGRPWFLNWLLLCCSERVTDIHIYNLKSDKGSSGKSCLYWLGCITRERELEEALGGRDLCWMSGEERWKMTSKLWPHSQLIPSVLGARIHQ